MDYTQLKRALNRLNEMLHKYESSDGYEPLIVDALREATVHRFFSSLEVAWKTCKRHLSEQGFIEASTGSPKSIMRLAFSNGLISDTTPWIRYIDARQNTAHDYSEEKLDAVIEVVGDFFRDAIALYEKISGEKWSDEVSIKEQFAEIEG